MPKPKSCPGPECPGCSSANCYAEGGNVHSGNQRENNEKGVNKSFSGESSGTSLGGLASRTGGDTGKRLAKYEHRKTLGELKAMPKPKLYAEGGEVHNTPEHPDAEQDKELIDDELHNMMGEEVMAAFDSKDKKRMMESIEAIVMSALSKE
jgi:hypothetical protein